MEVCQIVRGQRAFHRLTDQQKADMIKHTAMRPQERFRKIQETVSSFVIFKNIYLDYLLSLLPIVIIRQLPFNIVGQQE